MNQIRCPMCNYQAFADHYSGLDWFRCPKCALDIELNFATVKQGDEVIERVYTRGNDGYGTCIWRDDRAKRIKGESTRYKV